MWTRHRRRTHLSRLIVPALAGAVSLYFWHHSSVGRYGTEAQETVRADLALAEKKLAEVSFQRAELERDARLMRDGTIERDALDERARRILAMVGRNEVILITR